MTTFTVVVLTLTAAASAVSAALGRILRRGSDQ